jgi:hypothetical protein
VIALFVLAPVGAALTVLGGLYASIAVLVFSPFIGRLLVGRLEVFESREIDEILEMIPFASGRRLIGWVLQTEG